MTTSAKPTQAQARCSVRWSRGRWHWQDSCCCNGFTKKKRKKEREVEAENVMRSGIGYNWRLLYVSEVSCQDHRQMSCNAWLTGVV